MSLTKLNSFTMRIDILSAVPNLLKSPFEHSIVHRARQKGLVEIHLHDLRKYAVNDYGKIDDYPFGGGAGMVLMIEPIDRCISELREERVYDEIIYMTPDAKVFDQPTANSLSLQQNLMILCGHYKGVDQRVRDLYVTKEISIGDFVLSGGELPAMVMLDAIIRKLPNALGDAQSAEQDSFEQGLLDCPHYTRPEEYQGKRVPDILLSGNHEEIRRWRLKQALGRTHARRPDLLEGRAMTAEEEELLAEYLRERE